MQSRRNADTRKRKDIDLMLKRYTAIKKKSGKKKLRDEIGKLHLEILKKERGVTNRCEICGKITDKLGRFHVLRTGSHPRLEFCNKNILLTGWFCCHYPWHHNGPNDPKNKYIADRIETILGKDYEEQLLMIEAVQPKMTETYLQGLLLAFQLFTREEK